MLKASVTQVCVRQTDKHTYNQTDLTALETPVRYFNHLRNPGDPNLPHTVLEFASLGHFDLGTSLFEQVMP